MALVLAVSVVTGANEDLVLQCLDSLFASMTGSALELDVTVVCNTPGSRVGDRVRARYPGVRVVENAESRGFAANHNLTLRTTAAPYVLVLNDDVIFSGPTVEECVRYLESPTQRRVGALSPRLRNADGSLQPSTFSFPTIPRIWLDVSGVRDRIPTSSRLFGLARRVGHGSGRSRFWAHDRTCDVDTFRGAAMFVRTAAVRDVGAFDETTRVGGEETELHRRMYARGWRVVFFAGADVTHLGSQTVGVDQRLRVEYLKGYLNFFARHRSRGAFALMAGGMWVILVVRAMLAHLGGGADAAARHRRGAAVAWRWLWAGGGAPSSEP